MNFKEILFKVFITLLLLTGIYVLTSSLEVHESQISAYDTTCPDDMTDEACLDYLQEQAAQIREEQNNLDQSIEAENQEQMSLTQQINYLTEKIEETELSIAEKEVDIEKKNLEIRLLGEDIVEIQNNIDTIVQEINQLEEVIKERTSASYKLTFISPLEILLDSKNFEGLMRRSKYLVETKRKDKELMSDMSVSKKNLEDEEEILSDKKEEIQEKRNSIESQMAQLAQERKSLEDQKANQNQLLAESKQRESAYASKMEELDAIEEKANQQVAKLIMEMYEEGQLGDGTRVSTGDTVGFQGHTGCSFGSHLHFSMNSGTSYGYWGYFWGDVAPEPYMTSTIPQSGISITQGYHQGKSLDSVSTTEGNQLDNIYGSCWDNHPDKGQCYWVNKGDIPCAPSYTGWLPLQGEGAPVRTLRGGTVYYGREGAYGGKFAMVKHDNGYVSIYLHIR